MPFDIGVDSYLEFSTLIVSKLGLDSKLKALLFNKKGQPLIYNLDLLHSRLPKLDFSEHYYVIFTATPSVVDEVVVEPLTISNNLTEITVNHGSNKYTIEIDL